MGSDPNRIIRARMLIFGPPNANAPNVTTTGDALELNRAGWNRVAHRFYGGTALPVYGPLAPTEATLRLLGDTNGIRVLELGCGSGHSLHYLALAGAAELWGIDLSATQIEYATETLRDFQPDVHLFESAMEVDPGLPQNYFDLVFSIYGIGWTTDLATTLSLIERYLKPGGRLIFSGEHPAYSCLARENDRYVLAEPYTTEGARLYESWRGVPIVIQRRMLSTFVNEVVRAGLRLEALIETPLDESTAKDEHRDVARWYSVPRAQMMPTTFVIVASKPLSS